MSCAGSLRFFPAVWTEHVRLYRVLEREGLGRTIAYIESPDDFPLPVSFVGGPFDGQHSFPLDITVLTDTDII